MRRFPTLLVFALLSAVLFREAPGAGVSRASVARSFENDCRECHASGVPDRHHSLYGGLIVEDSVVPYPDADGDGFPDATYGCLSCHGPTPQVVRDCIVCHATPVGTVPDGSGLFEDPLTVSPAPPGALTLQWEPSCGVTDTDYIVYEGRLGEFASHTPILCSTAGNTWATFALPSGSAYYVVVPRNHWGEGSYGVDSDGTQRPPSVSACLHQTVGCPWWP